MFQLDPTASRWYPFQPFRVDDAGTLHKIDFFELEPLIFQQPFDGQPLADIVRELRKK